MLTITFHIGQATKHSTFLNAVSVHSSFDQGADSWSRVLTWPLVLRRSPSSTLVLLVSVLEPVIEDNIPPLPVLAGVETVPAPPLTAEFCWLPEELAMLNESVGLS